MSYSFLLTSYSFSVVILSAARIPPGRASGQKFCKRRGSNKQQTANEQKTPNDKPQITNNKRQKTNNKQQTNSKQQTNNKHQINNKQQTTKNKPQATNNREQTTNNKPANTWKIMQHRSKNHSKSVPDRSRIGPESVQNRFQMGRRCFRGPRVP